MQSCKEGRIIHAYHDLTALLDLISTPSSRRQQNTEKKLIDLSMIDRPADASSWADTLVIGKVSKVLKVTPPSRDPVLLLQQQDLSRPPPSLSLYIYVYIYIHLYPLLSLAG